MWDLFKFAFMQRALLVGIFVALSAGLLGVSLTLRRYSMIGDGLSHIGFGSIGLGLALSFNPFAFSIPVMILSAVLLLKLSDKTVISGDSAIALISSSALAIGVIASSVSKGVNIDISSFMFGSILAMKSGDVYLSIALSITVIAVLILMYNRIFSLSFDEEFARATGVSVEKISTILAVLTAVTISIGMRMVGVLLISSLIVFPSLTAQRIYKSFKSVMIGSAVISVMNMVLGLIASAAYALPPGASIVTVSLLVFLCATVYKFAK